MNVNEDPLIPAYLHLKHALLSQGEATMPVPQNHKSITTRNNATTITNHASFSSLILRTSLK